MKGSFCTPVAGKLYVIFPRERHSGAFCNEGRMKRNVICVLLPIQKIFILSLAHNIFASVSTEGNKKCFFFCVLFPSPPPPYVFPSFPIHASILMFIPKDHAVPSTLCQVQRQCCTLLLVENVPSCSRGEQVSPLVSTKVPSRESLLVVTQ